MVNKNPIKYDIIFRCHYFQLGERLHPPYEVELIGESTSFDQVFLSDPEALIT